MKIALVDLPLELGTNPISLSESRLKKLYSNDLQEAISMGFFEKIIDFFCRTHKHEVFTTLHQLLHSPKDNDSVAHKIRLFQELQRMAAPTFQDRFKMSIEELGDSFHIKLEIEDMDGHSISLVDNLHAIKENNKTPEQRFIELNNIKYEGNFLFQDLKYIVYDYVKQNESEFKIEFPNVKICDQFGNDELTSYLNFFMNNTPEIKNELNNVGLNNDEIVMSIYDILGGGQARMQLIQLNGMLRI